MRKEPSYARLAKILSGEKPVNLNHIGGNCYLKSAVLKNHCDLPKQFFTMSVALGDDIDFSVGQKTNKPFPNERSGP